MEIEGIFANEELMHDDSQGKYVIFVSVSLATFVVLRSTVGHRETRFMIFVKINLLMS